MKVAFARAPLPGKRHRNTLLLAQLMRQRNPIGQRELRPEMGDHTHDIVVCRAKVKGAIPPFGKALGLTLPLRHQPSKRHLARGKYPEIAVHCKQHLIGQHCRGDAHRYGLLPDPRKPLADLTATQQPQHLLLDHAWVEQLTIEGV